MDAFLNRGTARISARFRGPSWQRRNVAIVTLVLGLLLTGCSVGFQKSVRSSGTLCSDSRGWFIADATIGGAAGYFAATELNEPTAFIPTGVLLASAVYGAYKRRKCIGHRESATPEQWARDRDRALRKAEERRERERVALAERALAQARAVAARERAQAKALANAKEQQDAHDRHYDDRARARTREANRRAASRRPAPRSRSTPVRSTTPTTRSTSRVSTRTTTEVRNPPGYAPVKTQSECSKLKGKDDFSTRLAKDACKECIAKKKTFWVHESSINQRQCGFE